MSDNTTRKSSVLADEVRFRTCRPTDIPICAELEAASYPASEAASKSSLQYRQHHAARYFRCAVLNNSSTTTASAATTDPCGGGTGKDEDPHDDDDTVIGFICSTKCHTFTHESMSVHDSSGRLLAIHSVVVAEPYRRQGIATRMLKDYIVTISQDTSVEKMLLLAKENLLPFYLKCGFRVM